VGAELQLGAQSRYTLVLVNRRDFLITAAAIVAIVSAGWAGTSYLRSRQQAAAAAIAAAAAPIASGPTSSATGALQFLSDATTVPDVSMTDLDGRPLSSASWRGKVTIVNFWATWCPPCRAEIPDLIALQKKYGDRLQIIGISQDEDGPDVVRKFVAQQQMNYPIVMSTPAIEKAFPGIYALPTSFIIGPDGKIMQKHVGMLNAQLTERETRALAGLDTNVKIEYVEDETKALIRNAAQATKIPGINLDQLTPAQKAYALKRLNEEKCTCGCGLTLAACRINDPNCAFSLPLAQKIVEDAKRQ
jgi:thiol-disulfide isomerase/thioredoxin